MNRSLHRLHAWALLPCLLAGLLAHPSPAADIRLELQANREQLYLGESLNLTLRIAGADSGVQPDLSAVSNATIRLLGSHSDSHTSVTIINGQVRRESFTGRIFSYEITPSTAGTLWVGPIRVTAAKQRLEHPGMPVVVSGIEAQDDVQLSVTASRESVLVDEPFSIRFNLLIRLPQGLDADPLLPGSPPHLTIPYLAQGAPGPGLDTPSMQEILSQRVVGNRNQPAFHVNQYTFRNDPFDFDSMFNLGSMMEERPARFMFDRTLVEQDGKRYASYSISLTYTPREERSHTFGPILFKGPVITGIDATGNVKTRPVFAVGPACVVRVTPPPDEGRPDNYIGVLATNLSLEARLDTRTCNVGDPLTLALQVKGQGSFRQIIPPLLSGQPALTNRFRVYDDTVRIEPQPDGTIFRYTLRPQVTGTIELPPLAVAYYDTGERRYRTVQSPAIPLQVRDVTAMDAGMILAGSTNRNVIRLGNNPLHETIIGGITMNPRGATPYPPPLPPALWFLLAAGPLIYGLTVCGLAIRRRLPAWAIRLRAHHSGHTVARYLREAARQAPTDPMGASNHLVAAIALWTGTRLQADSRTFTPADLRVRLPATGLDAEHIDLLAAIMERHFNAPFTGTPLPLEVIRRDRDQLVPLLKSATKAPAAKTPAGMLLVIVLLVTVPLVQGAGTESATRQFIWEKANTLMATAREPAEFRTAAASYRTLLLAGCRHGAVYENLGIALFQAGHYPHAMQAFEQAERINGCTDTLRNNLLVTHRKRSNNPEAGLSWLRYPLFWHFNLSGERRLLLALLAFTGCWMAAAIGRLGFRSLARQFLAISLLLTIIMGTSALVSFVQYRHTAVELEQALTGILEEPTAT